MLFKSKVPGDELKFQDFFQYKTESTGQEKQGNTREENNCTFQWRILILRTDIWVLTGTDGSPLFSLITPFNRPPNFSQLQMHLTKRKGFKCFFSFSNSPVTLEPDCSPFSSPMVLQEVWLPLLSQNLPLTEGLPQAITHQVPAAVAQVSIAAPIRRQQWDGKVRNFLNIGSSKAGVLRQISAHRLWTTITAPTKKPLLLAE